ncbi:hypothetical protein ACFOU2_01905 [Bacillus songklensis]|uniref:Uncharacterized protein n=1 Tax=Bacillus songklensis TaxID=1069116 RepID=A0ABV8AZN7_9BACI
MEKDNALIISLDHGRGGHPNAVILSVLTNVGFSGCAKSLMKKVTNEIPNKSSTVNTIVLLEAISNAAIIQLPFESTLHATVAISVVKESKLLFGLKPLSSVNEIRKKLSLSRF